MRYAFTLFIGLLLCTATHAQLLEQYSWGGEINSGVTFPNIPDSMVFWDTDVYPSFSFAGFVTRDLGEHWTVEIQSGLTFHVLYNSLLLRYQITHFAAMHVGSSVQYSWITRRGNNPFVRLGGSMQFGYTASIADPTDNYHVRPGRTSAYTPFVRADFGTRNTFSWSINDSERNWQVEWSIFYRYGIRRQHLTFVDINDFSSTMVQGGSMLGLSLRFCLPFPSLKASPPENQRFRTPRTL